MELVTANKSADQRLEIENCLHTYFQVGDINRVSITGLQGAPFNDFAAGAAGARKVENDAVLRITKETNRVYPDATGTVEIRDEISRGSFAWRNSIPNPPSSGIRGQRRNCRTTSTRRNTGKWFA